LDSSYKEISFFVASSRGLPNCWKPYAPYLGKVKLNLGCWIFYQESYVNIDRNREVRADRYEDTATLPSFEANCADEIYAGHVAEHVDDVKASFGRWFEVLKPGGPHHHNSAGLSRPK
jgi:hypothetical protein